MKREEGSETALKLSEREQTVLIDVNRTEDRVGCRITERVLRDTRRRVCAKPLRELSARDPSNALRRAVGLEHAGELAERSDSSTEFT